MKPGDLVEICPFGCGCQNPRSKRFGNEDSHLFGVTVAVVQNDCATYIDKNRKIHQVADVGVIVASEWYGWIPDGLDDVWDEYNPEPDDYY